MLRNSSITVLGHFFTSGFRLGAIPFEWNPTSRRIRLTKSKWKLLQWYCITAYTISYSSFICMRLVQSICCLGGVHLENFVYGAFALVCWIIVSLFHVNTILYRHEVCSFINHFISANQAFKTALGADEADNQLEKQVTKDQQANVPNQKRKQSEAGKRKRWPKLHELRQQWTSLDSCGRLVCTLTVLCGEFCVGMIFPPLTLRYQPTFWYSLFPFFQECSWVYLIPWGFNEAFWTTPGAVIFLFYLFVIYAYVYSGTGILSRLKYGSDGRITTQNFGLLYRQLQFVNSSYNLAFKNLILPLVTSAFMAITMSCSFAIFKLYGTLNGPAFYILPLMTAMCIAMVFIMFPVCFKLRTSSNEIIESWMQTAGKADSGSSEGDAIQPVVTESFLKSCQPLGIRIRSFCVIEQSTVLEYFALVANQTLNLLLTFH